jgi:hypothetical protein
VSDFEHRPDSGRLLATQSKKHEKAPDYWGEIAINLSDLTKIEVVNGLHVIKLSGWKRKTKMGTTYLSLGVDRYVPKASGQSPAPKGNSGFDDMDGDVPF